MFILAYNGTPSSAGPLFHVVESKWMGWWMSGVQSYLAPAN